MLRFVTLATLLAVTSAYSYGGYGSGGYGSGGYGSGGYGSGGYGGGSYGGGVGSYITGAVQSRRSVSYYDVPSTYDSSPVTIDLPSGVQPLNFIMRSRSSPINIQTVHEGQPGSYAETSSVDEPHVRVHNVQRSLIHQVNEQITPYRQIRQQVLPVQESVEQVIARGSQGSYGGNQGYGGSYGGYGGSSYGNSNYGYGGQTGSYYK